MRLRLALAAALMCVLGALALEMSGSAPRLSGTDHTDPRSYIATVPPGGKICQPGLTLPADTGSVKLLVGTYGHELPATSAELIGAGGQTLASGSRPAGGHQGYVEVPLGHVRGSARAGTLCIRFRGLHRVAIGGTPLAESAASATVDGKSKPGNVAFYYLRRGRESWWELLPTLARRFGFGKASFFGVWTLPLMAFLLLATWVATIRLLFKEAS